MKENEGIYYEKQFLQEELLFLMKMKDYVDLGYLQGSERLLMKEITKVSNQLKQISNQTTSK